MNLTVPMSECTKQGFLDTAFVGWRSVEVMGAPGVGKSYLCQKVCELHSDIMNSSEAVQVRSLTEKDSPANKDKHGYRTAVRDNVARIQRQWARKSFGVLAPRPVRAYLAAIRNLVHISRVPPRTQRNVLRSTWDTSRLLHWLRVSKKRVLIDEGFIRKLTTLMVQSGQGVDRENQSRLAVDCLRQYPWERRAIFLHAPAEVCVQRQHARGHVIESDSDHQQEQLDAAETALRLLYAADWDVVEVQNHGEDRIVA